jgi:hypothetical protein
MLMKSLLQHLCFSLAVTCVLLCGCAAQQDIKTPIALEVPEASAASVATRRPQPLRSLAAPKYTGLEERPVTLKPGVKVSREQMMRRVDKTTMVIVVRNQSGIPIREVQADVGTSRRDGGGFFGQGPLLDGEWRIIKARRSAPGWVRLVWHCVDGGGGSWRSRSELPGRDPLVLTIREDDTVATGARWQF